MGQQFRSLLTGHVNHMGLKKALADTPNKPLGVFTTENCNHMSGTFTNALKPLHPEDPRLVSEDHQNMALMGISGCESLRKQCGLQAE